MSDPRIVTPPGAVGMGERATRLAADDDGLAERLHRNRLTRRDTMRLFGLSVSASAVAATLQGCASSPVTGERILVGMSESISTPPASRPMRGVRAWGPRRCGWQRPMMRRG